MRAISRSWRKAKREKRKEPCFRPVSNRGPFACEANVITTTLRKLTAFMRGARVAWPSCFFRTPNTPRAEQQLLDNWLFQPAGDFLQRSIASTSSYKQIRLGFLASWWANSSAAPTLCYPSPSKPPLDRTGRACVLRQWVLAKALAVFQTADYTSGAYYFGWNSVCSRQYAKTCEICSILQVPGCPTDPGKFLSMQQTSLPGVLFPTMHGANAVCQFGGAQVEVNYWHLLE